MTTRIGIDVRDSEVCAVMLHRGDLCWHARATMADGDDLSACVNALLGDAPRRQSRHGRLHVALGPAKAHVKRMEGLSSGLRPSELTHLVREHPSSWFLRMGGDLAIPDVHVSSDGVAWAATLDRAAVMAVVGGARHYGIHVRLAIPTVAAMGWQPRSAPFVLSDGEHHIELTTHAGALVGMRRVSMNGERPSVPEALHGIGADAIAYAGAYAAAMSTRRSPLAWIPDETPARALAVRRLRLVTSAASLAIALTTAMFAPSVRAAMFVHHHTPAEAPARAIERDATLADAELRRDASMLGAIGAFDARRGQIVRLLGELSRALPESTALVSLRVDSIEGSFVAVAPHVTDVLSELGTVEEIASVKLAGSVTREMLGGTRVERATVRFRRPRTPRE